MTNAHKHKHKTHAYSIKELLSLAEPSAFYWHNRPDHNDLSVNCYVFSFSSSETSICKQGIYALLTKK